MHGYRSPRSLDDVISQHPIIASQCSNLSLILSISLLIEIGNVRGVELVNGTRKGRDDVLTRMGLKLG